MQYSIDDIEKWNVDGERHILSLIKQISQLINKQNIKILDVGSNIGKFPELLSKYVTIDDAILIEPVIELLEYSKRKFPQYTFINAAISNSVEPLHLHVPTSNNLGISRVLEHYLESDPDIRMVQSLKLSNILLETYPNFNPDVIKIDAEGLDIEIVEELSNYIIKTNNKPLIIFEVDSRADISSIIPLYENLDYKVDSNGVEGCSRDIFLIPK